MFAWGYAFITEPNPEFRHQQAPTLGFTPWRQSTPQLRPAERSRVTLSLFDLETVPGTQLLLRIPERRHEGVISSDGLMAVALPLRVWSLFLG